MTNQPEDTEKVYCNNCDWKGTVSQLGAELFETRDLASRLEPGEEVPAGECPKCAALSTSKIRLRTQPLASSRS